MKSPLLGAHVSIAGGILNALRRGHELQCSTIQIFTKNASQWKERVIDADEGRSFRILQCDLGIKPVISHAAYLINLASPFGELYQRSINAVADEVKRCTILGIPYLVIHPGAHTGCGEARAIELLIKALDRIHDKIVSSDVMILMEISAGQGTSICYTAEQIAEVLQGVKESDRIGFCLDTAHAFAAGYEFRTRPQYQRFISDISSTIGLGKLKVIHLNDSKTDCGSRVDRHEHIAKGMIGRRPFRWIMNDERLTHIPKIIETPGLGKDVVMDRKNLDFLRKLANT
jgi:deoxyribonuclease-4